MNRSAALVARRLAVLVPLLVAVSFIVFSLLYIAPGNPVQVLLGTRPRSPELVRTLTHEFHLDKSFLDQYWLWLRGAAHLDLGTSIHTGLPVTTMISQSLGLSTFLTLYGAAIALGLGVPLGVVAALRRGGVVDRGVVGLSVFGFSTPSFVAGIILLYFFAVRVRWFPTYGAGGGFFDRLWHLTLPAFALALVVLALVVKLTRAAALNVLDQDYVTFALARGVPQHRVVLRHVLRNALIPLITAAGLVLTAVLTGGVLVEATFSLPGLGSLLVNSVGQKDIPVVQGLALLIASTVVGINLLVDVLYILVDPRIRYGSSTR